MDVCPSVCACEEELLGPRKVFSTGTGSQKKNFSGPGKFFRLSWDQGFEYVMGTGSQKNTFRAPESFFGFRGTRGSNM